MFSLATLAQTLHQPSVNLSRIQRRFELPLTAGDSYSPAYLEWFRTLFALRRLGTPEDAILELWVLEKKLLQLLHVDSTGSLTWYLDACGATTHPERRLLLTNHDLGIPLATGVVQPGLNFASAPTELFGGKEMGEDAIRVLRDCLKLRARILAEVSAEVPHLRAAIKWASAAT